MSKKMATGYYGVDGGVAPIFSCGAKPLAPSFLAGAGSHRVLWVSVALHVAALGCTAAACVLFMAAEDGESGAAAPSSPPSSPPPSPSPSPSPSGRMLGDHVAMNDDHMSTGWALASVSFEVLAVVGTLVATALVRDVFSVPIANMAIFGCFIAALLATTKISYKHGVAMDADAAENMLYNASLLFQAFAFGSILSNGIAAISAAKEA